MNFFGCGVMPRKRSSQKFQERKHAESLFLTNVPTINAVLRAFAKKPEDRGLFYKRGSEILLDNRRYSLTPSQPGGRVLGEVKRRIHLLTGQYEAGLPEGTQSRFMRKKK